MNGAAVREDIAQADCGEVIEQEEIRLRTTQGQALMPTPDERFHDLFTTRPIVVDLPIGAERRVKAYLHRLNAELALLEEDGENMLVRLNDDFDLAMTLVSLAERSLERSEEDIGTRYDTCTGRPVAELEQLEEA